MIAESLFVSGDIFWFGMHPLYPTIVSCGYMAGPLDILITRLLLQDDFSEKAEKAKKKAGELSEELEALKDANGNLSALMRNAAIDAMKASPALMQVVGSAARAAMSVGGGLGRAAASAVSLLATPQGLAVAAGIAAAALAVLANAAAYAGGLIGGLLTNLGMAVPTLITAFSTALGPALSLPFIKASAEMDRFERQFTAIFGGQRQGQMVTKFMQQYGLTSALNQSSLAQLIKTIGLSGNDIGRFLPVLETFTFLGNDTPDAAAEDIASIFRRLVGGQTADAFGPEGLGRFGINRKMLQMYGASFDNQGRFLGNTEDALRVLERLATESPVLKDLRAVMESSSDTQLSNAWDAVKLAITEIGKTLAITVLPVINTVTGWIRNMAESGGLQRIAEKFSSLIGNPDMFKPLIAQIMSMVETLPTVVKLVGDFIAAASRVMHTMIKSIADAMISFSTSPLGLALAAMTGGASFTIPLTLGTSMNAGLEAADALSAGVANFFNGTNPLFPNKYNQWMAILNAPGKPGQTGPLPVAQLGMDTETMTANQHLAAIERNTREMVEAQRIVLGGGQLGALGVTAVDVFGGRRGPARGGSVGEVLTSSLMDDMFDRLIAGRISGAGMAR